MCVCVWGGSFAIARAANASTCYSAYIAQYAAMPAPPALRATPLLLSAIVAAKAREIADATNREATKATGPWPSPAETNPDAFGQWGGLPQGSSISPWQWLQNAQSSALAQPQDFDEEGMRVLVAEEEEEMRLRCSPPSPEQAQDEGWGWGSEAHCPGRAPTSPAAPASPGAHYCGRAQSSSRLVILSSTE